MTVTIRDATTSDAEIIATFNATMAKETEDKALAPETLLAGVSALLHDDTKGRYWLACEQDMPVGQIMVTWEWSDWRNGYFWWIQSVYVAPTHRRRGVFRALYDAVAQAAKQSQNAVGIRLYVEKDNANAISTYDSIGFTDAGYLLLERLMEPEQGTELC